MVEKYRYLLTSYDIIFYVTHFRKIANTPSGCSGFDILRHAMTFRSAIVITFLFCLKWIKMHNFLRIHAICFYITTLIDVLYYKSRKLFQYQDVCVYNILKCIMLILDNIILIRLKKWFAVNNRKLHSID